MTKDEFIDIKEEITELKNSNIEEFIFILKYYLETWFNAVFSFGPTHKVTKDCNKIFKEMCSIFKEESLLCDFILYKGKDMDCAEVYKFKDKLDDINEETLLYYVKLLDDIASACDTKQEFRATRLPKDFNTLIDNYDYRKELYGLILNMDTIKEFLNYPQEFWDYVMPKVRVVDIFESQNEHSMNYEVIMKLDSNNCLTDMRVIVPEIINLTTALINIHEFKHAYDLYNMLGSEVPKNIEYFEKSASKLEDNFTNEYMMKLIK